MARDIGIALRIQAAIDGLQQVRALVDGIDDLGEEGARAAQELTRLTDELGDIGRQQQLIQQFRQQKLAVAEAARAYEQARQRSSELGRALGQTEAPTKRQAAEFERARAATRRLADAHQAAQVELEQTRRSLTAAGGSTRGLAAQQQALATRADTARASLDRLNREVQELATARRPPDVTAPLAAGAERTSTIIAGIPRLLAAIGVTVGLAQVVQQFTAASKSAVTFEGALLAITGSAERAAAEQQRLEGLAERFGLELQSLERSALGWSAAVEGTVLQGRQADLIFESIVGTMATLGQSTADTSLALQALQQIVSKGAVSMEELRQQLGERVYGAFRLAAEGMGITTRELTKLVESGNLAAEDLLPKLARELREAYGLDAIQRVETLTGAQNRLTNSFTIFFRELDQATGATGFIARALDSAAVVIRDLARGTDEAITSAGTLADTQRAGAQDADGYAIEMDKARQAAGGLGEAAAAAKPPVDELNQSLREQRAIGLQQELDSLRETLNRTADQVTFAKIALGNLKNQGVDPAAKAFQDQLALIDAGEQRMATLGERYNRIAQQLRETLNPALREQAQAQAQAAEATEEAARSIGRSAEDLAEFRRLLDAGIISQATFDQFAAGIDRSRAKLGELRDAGGDTAKALRDIYAAIDEAERGGEDPATADFRAQLQILADLRRQQGLLNEARKAGADAVKAEQAAAQAGSDAERQAAEAAADAARQRQRAALEAAGAEARQSQELAENIDDVRTRANLLRQLAGVLEQVLAGEQAAEAAGKIDQAAGAVERLRQSIEGADGPRLEFDDIGRQLDAIDARTVRPTVEPERRALDDVDRRLQTLQRGVTIPVRIRVSGDTGLLSQLEQANLGLN